MRRKKHWFVILLICAFICWFLYVPWPESEPTTFGYQANTLTNWPTQPGEQDASLLFVLRERGREGEKHLCVVASSMPLIGDPAPNQGRCPDWESNQWPFASQASTQSTELYQPGNKMQFLKGLCELNREATVDFFFLPEFNLFFKDFVYLLLEG